MTFDHDSSDPVAARLRAALTTEAGMVNPSDDGLRRIRSRTAAGAGPWWQHPGVLAVAAAVVLGLVVGGGVALLAGDGEDGNVIANQTTTAPEPSASSESSGSDTPSPTPTARDAVWVYYVMDDPVSGPRLYREQHAAPAGPPGAAAAVQEIFTAPATDPDYTSLWPSTARITGYRVTGDTATVDVTDFPAVGAAFESVAVQQLVYTVTANDTSVKQIRMLVDGKAPRSGHADWSEPVSRAPMVDVQGFIWLLTPTEGTTVSSPVAITGYGTAFEATISWEVRRTGSDEVVAEGFTQGGSMGEFGEFADSVELEPGTYEMRAFESSAEDGRPLHVDTKTFTVR